MTDHGKFCWYELMTSDDAAAEKYYTNVVGWSARDSGMPGPMKYTLLSTHGRDVGGLMTLTEQACQMGAQPGWMGYVAVDDVDKGAAKAKELGGGVHMAPQDIPGVGRFSVIHDPQRAAITLFKPAPGAIQGPELPPATEGLCGWHELYTSDWEAGFKFYAAMFGWTKGETMDMGPMGKYQIFLRNGEMVGGMMNKPPQMPMSAWGYYFIVGNIDEAITRVQNGGGQVIHGPIQVPGGGWIIQGMDPQKAMFALVGTRPA